MTRMIETQGKQRMVLASSQLTYTLGKPAFPSKMCFVLLQHPPVLTCNPWDVKQVQNLLNNLPCHSRNAVVRLQLQQDIAQSVINPPHTMYALQCTSLSTPNAAPQPQNPKDALDDFTNRCVTKPTMARHEVMRFQVAAMHLSKLLFCMQLFVRTNSEMLGAKRPKAAKGKAAPVLARSSD